MSGDKNTWINPIVSHLQLFKDFHPVGSTRRVQIETSFYTIIQHYAPGAYYCVTKCNDDNHIVFVGVVCPFYKPYEGLSYANN